MTINFYVHFVIENNLVSYLYLEYFCIFNLDINHRLILDLILQNIVDKK